MKFLEGYLTPTLRKYATDSLHRWQMGFVPGVSTETCKADVLAEMATLLDGHIPSSDARRAARSLL